MSDYALEGLLKLRDETGPATKAAGDGLGGVGNQAKRATEAFGNFEVSNKSLYDALLQTDRGATATREEIDDLAIKLGVAAEKQVRAAKTARELVDAWRRGDITADDLNDSLQSLNAGLDNTATKQDSLTGIVRTAQTAMAAFGVREVGKTIANLAVLGAQVKRTEDNFESYSGGAEIATANLNAVMTATQRTITVQDAMRLSTRLLSMGLAENAGELADLTEIASRLGGAMGKEAAPAVEDFSLLLANKSKERFDTFGLSVTAIDDRIENLRRTTRGLSEDQIFLQAVLEEGRAKLETLGPPLEDQQQQLEQLNASWGNFKNEVGEAYASVVAILAPLAELLDFLTAQQKIVNDLTEEYGFFITRLGVVGQLLGGGPGPLQNLVDFSIQRQYNQQQQVPDYRTGRAEDRRAGMSSQSVTMYNPQFYGVQDPQNMLDQLNRMGP